MSNPIRQFTIEMVRTFDDAMIHVVRFGNVEDINDIKRARADTFDMIDAASSMDDLYDALVAAREKDAYLPVDEHVYPGASTALDEINMIAAMIQSGAYEESLNKLVDLDVGGEDVDQPASDRAAEIVNHRMDRAILSMIESTDHIGLLRNALPALRAIREDLLAIVVLDSRHDMSEASDSLKRWANNPLREPQIGAFLVQEIRKMADDIADIAPKEKAHFQTSGGLKP